MKKWLIIMPLILLLTKAYTQQNPDQLLKQISPLTPNAASLGKFGDIPVSLYTGIPNVQIPLYEIVVKDFRLPIALSYHAGGVKVNDIASWVGTGWALSAGGLISRQQRGVYDEYMIDKKSDFYDYIQTILNPSATESQKAAASNTLSDVKDPEYDTESDIFTINAGSLSQKFFLDIDNNAYCIPTRKLSIINEGRTYYQGNRSMFDRWRVKDENGVEYIFGKTIDGTKTEVETFYMKQLCNVGTTIKETVSSWYLNEIKLPSGESIKFSYDYYYYCHDLDIQESFNASHLYRSSTQQAINYTKALRIKEIIFPNGKITFDPGDFRKDFLADKVLDKINIYTKQAGNYVLFKTFKFITNNPAGATTQDLSFRLKLGSIEEIDGNAKKNGTYSFEYNNGTYSNLELPARNSKAQDLWGYANGQIDNTTLIPSYIIRYTDGAVFTTLNMGNRSINTEKAKAGILSKITYPTGGYSEFEYESNIARGIVESRQRQPGAQVTKSINPLYVLDNMRSTNVGDKSTGISLENINGNSEAYSSEFEIINPNGISVNVTGYMTWANSSNPCVLTSPMGGANGSFYECVTVSFEKRDASALSFEPYQSNVYLNRPWFLPKGIYRAKLKWHDASQIGSWFRISVTWQDYDIPPDPVITDATERVVGGLRIAKITDYDPVSQKAQVRKYSYVFNGDDAEGPGSSGYIQEAPLYSYVNTLPIYDGTSWLDCASGCFYLTSNVNSSILQTNGGLVGYKKVTVDYGNDGEAGRKVTYFLSPKDYPDGNIIESQEWPFPHVTDLDWRRGLIDREISYKYAGGNFLPLRIQKHTYQFNSTLSDPNYKFLQNVKIYKNFFGWFGENPGYVGSYRIYNTQAESFYLKESITTEKSSAGDVITITTNEQSQKSLRDASATFANSNNGSTTTYTIYAADIFDNKTIGNNTATLGVRNLISNFNMTTSPIEQYIVETKSDGSKYVTGGRLTVYYPDKPLPKEIYTLELSSPLLLGSFIPCKIDVSGNFVKDPNYKLQVTFDSYNDYHNLLEQHKENDIHSSYLWGYNQTYPVVKIEGVDYNSIGSEVKTSVANRDYTSSSSYDMVKVDVEYLKGLFSTFSSSGKHLVTIYTYSPLVGITSQTDSNGITTYYEYDDFGRLKCIKNNDGSILKTYDYHYKE